MTTPAAAAAAAATAASTRANSLSRIFSSSSPVISPPKRSPKTKRAPTPTPTPKPPAADAGSIADEKPPKPVGAQPAAKAESNAKHKLPKPLGIILKALIRQRDPDKLVSDFVQASTVSSRFRDRHRVFEVAVSRLNSLGRQDGIEAIIEAQMPFLETSAEGFAARLIRLYGRASMPSHAAATFHKLPAQHKSTMTFNSVLSAYADAGDFDGLTAAFQEIPATHPSIVPTVYSYNVLIHALCQKPDISAALDAVHLMEKHGIPPDIITFNTLLNGFCNNGRVHEAETVWEMIKERNLEPDAKCYNAKLRGLVAEGRIDDAAAVLERLEKDGPKPDTVSYNELIRGYCKAGRLQEAKKLYDDLVKNECTPNKGTYETLLPQLLQAGELDCALTYCYKIFSDKRNLRVECGVLQDVVNALVDVSRVEEAAKIVVLGRKKYYPRKGLRMPDRTKDSELRAETDEEEAISEEEECEVEHETEK
ncbi:pentatricopeptide repeat-containing protein At3g13160, mitochondrial-like [Hordeum vulgare subsp. vulgare]|nr:pentatricopeptide repeat-containing protein At3g13160, mitochondrial-like [Hordeum vulgare subsp. vulgare]